MVQEEAPKGRLMDTAAALAVLEDAGQVALQGHEDLRNWSLDPGDEIPPG